ncbi:PTS sugar transporter subunit IIA [Atopobacter phocae]|uniref:PTS sugar transporter subunit IIA n=1 Tax=Atopobacter phocae TaxID=136492 RepID=UPI00046E5950|nr:PTS sugar transporter subunit IIA [Atopobacter phocae]
MIGIVIATHGKLAEGILHATQVIFGDTNNIQTVSLNQEDNIEVFGNKINTAISEVNQEEGVIVFVDIEIASPYNQSMLTINKLQKELKDKLFIITGVNLPMVLEAINQQLIDAEVEQAVQNIIEIGTHSVKQWSASVAIENDDFEDDF